MKCYLLFFILGFVLIAGTGCKSKKKKSPSGDDPVEVADFIGFFPEKSLPYGIADSVFISREKDSNLVAQKVFNQFVPDTVLGKLYAKNAKIKIYPVARFETGNAETYLLAKTLSADKKAVYLLAFDKARKFMTAIPVMRPMTSGLQQTVSMDRKYTITKSVLKKNADGSMSEGKDVYVLNADAKQFMLIMTEALDDKVTELVNPIDTLPRKNKYSGDFSNGKMTLISIRDGRKSDRISFYIHFEKNNGECTGELKGEALMKTANTAEYHQDGDPCVLKFILGSQSVTLKEVDGCGSRRGLRCSFDGSYARKKEAKPPVVKKKTKGK